MILYIHIHTFIHINIYVKMYVYMYIKAEIVYSDKTKINTFTIISKDILENYFQRYMHIYS